ncbi:MAG: class I mannose-6-phosphate isomerase [Saprospiraceae bacterium]|nr:class I mannose-6-phosphate isomerase [Lewinella sp.]
MERNTCEPLIPIEKQEFDTGHYDLYPAFPITGGNIEVGYDTLADILQNEKTVLLDGYVGVDWDEVGRILEALFKKKGLKVAVFDIRECLRPENEIAALVEPYLGSDDPIFGYKTDILLEAYFDKSKMNRGCVDASADINLIYGTGAALCDIEGALVYFDLPKNELQFRMRAGAITNIGFSVPKDPKQMYKHFYFVDWVVLNREKKRLLPHIDIIVDQQRPQKPVWTTGEALRKSLSKMSRSYFRVRPWFEPGVWGGQWMKRHFPGLNPEAPNYAWSFEMIVPENGLVFEDQGKLLEVSFDMLMYWEGKNVLGKAAKRFHDEFPIRFDFLDTFEGGNLSVQCHPRPEYIKEQFGENFTQDETYYILDAGDDAEVYLGFQEGIEAEDFQQALEHSYETKQELDVVKYVQKLPAKKHDLFLIPHGTVHCSGRNNLVLEISATPYIYTFKMYDWLRLDLDGNPRPLNIKRAMENLNFDRQGQTVENTLVSKPEVISWGAEWQKVHLPTHPDHFYDIYRYEFDREVIIENLGQCHVLMLIEGTAVVLDFGEGSQTFHYAETFAVPAATGSYKLVNKDKSKAKVVVSYVKDEAC